MTVAFYDITADPSSQYYVGPIGSSVPSGDDIRAEVTAQVDDDIAHGWLGKVVTPLARDKEIQKRYSAQIAKARQGLHNGVEMRNPGAAPHTVWNNATHEQMQSTISENANSATVAVSSEEWVRLGNELTDHQQNLADAINDSVSDWQGSGGDAARQHLAEVGKWLGVTAKGATLTGRQQEIHSQTLNETQKQMAANPPVQFSTQEANARLQQITDPIQYAQQAQQDIATLRAQEAARGQAARIMTQFDETIGGATATPAFPAPPKLARGLSASTASLSTPGGGAGGGTVPGATAGNGAVPSGTGLPSESVPGGTAGSGAVPSGAGLPSGSVPGSLAPGQGAMAASLGSGGSVPGVPGGFDAAGGNQQRSSAMPLSASAGGVPKMPTVDYPGAGGSMPSLPDGTSPSSITGTDLSSAGGSGKLPTIGWSGGVNGDSIASRLGGSATPTGSPLAGLDSLGEVPGAGGAAGRGLGTGGAAGRGLGGIGGSASGLGGLGAAGRGLGGEGVGGSAARLGGVGGGASGLGGLKGGGSAEGGGASRLTAGAGSAAAAEEAAAARTAAGTSGAAGRPGTPGAGMGGGGARKGEEDKEHRVADYLEGDPDLFEPGQIIAPPVIGNWKKPKDDKKN
jgi:hypothetical protein